MVSKMVEVQQVLVVLDEIADSPKYRDLELGKSCTLIGQSTD